MTEEKIRKLLKMYGASDEEIENFMHDLKNMEDAPSDTFDPDDDNDLELEDQLKKDAKDEQEAIEGYDKTLKEVDNDTMRKQINQIKKEEIAHKKYLEEAQKNPNAKYHDPR